MSAIATAFVAHTSGTLLPGTVIASSDEDAAYPASRLRNGRAASKMRTGDATGAKTITFTFAQPLAFGALSIRGHNLSSGSTITAEIGPSGAEAVAWAADEIRHLFLSTWEGASLVVTITDPASPDGYQELGTCDPWICHEVGELADPAMVHEQIDTSVAVAAPMSQQSVTRERSRPRRTSHGWTRLAAERARATLAALDVLRHNGRGWICGDVAELADADRSTIGVLQTPPKRALSFRHGAQMDIGPVTMLEDTW